ncbi:hypothetical protein GCM10007895_05080 [Paraferrimonas sedimenticola]|uniref:Uncharacterized protein n=1 Tax=Paraferrimonas sedimenticola TaxID=375674 RepID=A0AA37W0L6_9GAMM|nr:hypothetical protein GCM10007895_05080 [Paraferrimonas sedimenticola]
MFSWIKRKLFKPKVERRRVNVQIPMETIQTGLQFDGAKGLSKQAQDEASSS